MTTVVNNPPPQNNNGGPAGMIIGVILVLVLTLLFFVYGLPMLRGTADSDRSGINVDVPENIDVNVNPSQQ